MWVKCDGDDFEVLDLESFEEKDYPERAQWFFRELPEMGLSWFVQLGYRIDLVAWIAEHGIAPNQPFRLRIQPCKYSVDYWGESDIEQGDWELVDVEKWPKEHVEDAWVEWLNGPLNEFAEVEQNGIYAWY